MIIRANEPKRDPPKDFEAPPDVSNRDAATDIVSKGVDHDPALCLAVPLPPALTERLEIENIMLASALPHICKSG
ncbi:hypothetical protein [Sinorhizobium fredii]|uniref:hypothetical protein n=1 Tax=Rhizobium fredii TaxID=380 RepID=UPI0004B94A00|nr:hypothetical protein [Sinorhizobium fredii]AWM24096.1 hypothetical protein AOX55_0000819 [Sinorhizobium fredii CCBAU 25509]